jgi:serine/threonine protein kinase/tetratricopeptide (TPR) repeat protein
VWAGEHVGTGMPVSVKFMTGDKARESAFINAFENEVRAVASLDHPAIIRVLDLGRIPEGSPEPLQAGVPYLVMELASGGTLRAADRRAMVWPEMKTILLTLLSALGHAHARGIIHRDLKPGNVLVCAVDDPRPGLKLSDFGLARRVDALERSGSVEPVRGTLHYMAPEQCQGRWRDQGPWTDLYALGCIAYQLATGRPPFRGASGDALMNAHLHEPPPALPPRRGLPDGYAEWVGRLLAKAPEDRPQRAADAAWLLAHLKEPDDVGPQRWIFPDLAAHQGLSESLPTPQPLALGDIDDVDDPTEILPTAGATSLATPTRTGFRRSDVPPVPASWREPQAPPNDIRLVGSSQRILGLRRLSLVGRHRERDALWNVLLDVDRHHAPGLVLLSGGYGSGVSRLAAWICVRAHEVGAAHVAMLGHRDSEEPARAIVRSLERVMGTSGLEPEQAAEHARRLAHRFDRPEWADLLAEALGPSREGHAAERALAAVLQRMAEDRPVILRVEDLQTCPSNASLLVDLMGSGKPILVVATLRDEDALTDPHPALRRLLHHPGAVHIHPGPLSSADMRSLLRGQLGLSAPLSLQIEERAAGNPAFATQLVLQWADQGLLLPTPLGFVVAEDTPLQIPDDLHTVWARRLQGVLRHHPSRISAWLERAAVLGARFSARTWHDACGPQGAVERNLALEDMVHQRLLYRDHQHLVFAHAMLRESLLRSAAEGGREVEHHRACAEVLRARTREGWRVQRRLAMHLHAAGDRAGAVPVLLHAASGASADGESGLALSLVCLAMEAMDLTTDPLASQAMRLRLQAHAARGEFPEADRWEGPLTTAASSASSPQHRADLFLNLTHYALTRGHAEKARQFLDHARDALQEYQPNVRNLSLTLAEGHLARLTGDLHTAALRLREAIAMARDRGHATTVGIAQRQLGAILWRVEDYAGAEHAFTEALHALHAGPLADLAAVYNNLGECARRVGDLEEAELSYERSADLFERAGAASFPYPLVNLGIVRVHQGRHHEALEPLGRALEEFERQGDRSLEAVVRLLILACCAALGDWAGWTQQLTRLHDLEPPKQVDREVVEAVRDAARVAVQAGRPLEARHGYELAAALYERLGSPNDALACEESARDLT